jgi:phenylacetyl-CoA:acceptor oxidoreductase 26-kDa subunit
MSFGPRPWRQLHWDARAAANFICGGTGSGLVVLAAIVPLAPRLNQAALLLGLVLVAAGLASVWLEIGRKLRAVHVFFNPFTSWMTRESFAALALFAAGAPAVWTAAPPLAALAALCALGFVYCQGRILRASKGIPAWREPTVTWLVFWTAIAEGAGLFLVFATLAGASMPALAAGTLALAVVARGIAWSVYRGRVGPTLAPKARAALESAGKQLYQLGAIAPLALLLAGGAIDAFAPETAALAGAAAIATGWRFKFVLLVRASFNQGFALPRVPVRGGK